MIREDIKKLMAEGDKRSYHEIAADLELERWAKRQKDAAEFARKMEEGMPLAFAPEVKQVEGILTVTKAEDNGTSQEGQDK